MTKPFRFTRSELSETLPGATGLIYFPLYPVPGLKHPGCAQKTKIKHCYRVNLYRSSCNKKRRRITGAFRSFSSPWSFKRMLGKMETGWSLIAPPSSTDKSRYAPVLSPSSFCRIAGRFILPRLLMVINIVFFLSGFCEARKIRSIFHEKAVEGG
jgi:hypothetical protein